MFIAPLLIFFSFFKEAKLQTTATFSPYPESHCQIWNHAHSVVVPSV